MRRSHCGTLLALFAALSSSAVGQAPAGLPAVGPPETKEQFAKRTQWWSDARFGMFIHWGLYAVAADVTGKDGKTRGLAEWHMSNKQMQVKEYEKYAARFNPANFDAAKWVRAAKYAGMKYIVITSKHHDGFAMFDSKLSDYNIAKATAFRRDPIAELAAECKKQGLVLCFYHSIMDWHHPDYLPRRPWEGDNRSPAGAKFDRYIAYMKGQIKELLTNYGRIGVMWFDGEWENTWNHAMGMDLYHYVRSIQPDALVNNRVDKGRQGMEGMNKSAEFMGDFGTPEQEIPANGFKDGRLWESCMTMNDTWGFARNDPNWKPASVLIRNLIDVASKGGNYLLNVGPTDLGELTPETLDRLSRLGDWMKVNAAAIHGASAGPISKLEFDGRCTQKGNRLYLHVFDWPADGLRVSGLSAEVRSASALLGKERLKVTRAAGPAGTVYISRPTKLDPTATVVELQLAGTAKASGHLRQVTASK